MKQHSKILMTLTSSLMLLSALPAAAASGNWTGYYAGFNAGASLSDTDVKTTAVAGSYFAGSSITSINANGDDTLSANKFTGGVQGGVNIQEGNFVYGIEGDFGAFNAGDSTSVTAVYPCCGPDTYTLSQSVDTDWIFTARPRIGWAMGDFLLYGTGGLSVTKLEYTETFTDTYGPTTGSSSKTETRTGWNLGAGAEFAVDDAWSAKAEYLYTDFGKLSASSTNLDENGTPHPTAIFRNAADLTSSIVRVGFNRKF